MKRIFLSTAILPIALLLSTAGAKADVSPIARLKEIPAPKNDCKDFELEVTGIIVRDVNRDTSVPSDRIQSSIKKISDLEKLQTDISPLVIDGMSKDPEKTYKELSRLAHGDCAIAAFRLFKALIATAVGKATTNTNRKAIDSALRDWLKQIKSPTLLSASADLALAELAVEKGLWTPSTAQAKSLTEQRSQVKTEIAEVNKWLYGTEDPNSENLQPPASLDFKKVQPGLVKESQAAASENQKLKEFVTNLQ